MILITVVLENLILYYGSRIEYLLIHSVDSTALRHDK